MMRLGINRDLDTYGILDYDFWTIQGLRDKDQLNVELEDGEVQHVFFRNVDGNCWLEKGFNGEVVARGRELEGIIVSGIGTSL